MITAQRPMTTPEWLLLFVLSLLWGGSFFFVEIAIEALPPLTVVLVRVAIAAMALCLFVVLSGQSLRLPGRTWLALAGMSALNNLVPFCLIVWGQTRIGGGLASIINATTPFFTVIIAHLLTHDERLTGGKVAGLLLGIVGVVGIIGPDALQTLGLALLAQLAVLGAALSYACAGVYGKRFRTFGITPLQTATGQLLLSTLLIAPFALVVDRPWTLALPDVGVWAALVGLALLSTALAYVIYFRLLASAGATNLLLVTFLIPVSAIVLGIAFLGETLAPGHVVGLALIGLGLVAIDGRLVRRFTRWSRL